MTSPDAKIAFPDEETLRHIRKPLAHDSARKHVQGCISFNTWHLY